MKLFASFTFTVATFVAVQLLSIQSIAGERLNFDSNVPADIKQQVLNDLAFMSEVNGEKQSPLHKEIFGSLGGEKYKAFFESRVTGVGMSPCGSPNAVACVQPFFAPNKMWLTQNYIKFSHPQIARLMVIYHEARHTEKNNGNWMHANCPKPFLDETGNEIKSIWTQATLAGEPACDTTVFGSYGSSTIMISNISRFCENCSEKVKMDAEMYAADQAKRIISAQAVTQLKKDFQESL